MSNENPKKLDVPYYNQPKDSQECGAACAQMVLRQIGRIKLAQTPEDPHAQAQQDALFDNIKLDNNPNYNGSPNGITTTLNSPPLLASPVTLPPGSKYSSANFKVIATQAEFLTSLNIVITIYTYNVAPIALVYNGGHWVVVNGVHLNGINKTGSVLTTKSIVEAFYIHNPAPFEYEFADKKASGESSPDGQGIVAYESWGKNYLLENDHDSVPPIGLLGGQFIAICYQPLPQPLNVAFPKKNKRAKHSTLRARTDKDLFISHEAAITAAMDGIAQYGLREREPWKSALSGATTGAPLLVKELHQFYSFYYLVPWEDERNQVSLLISVDALSGTFQEAVAFPKRTLGKIPRYSPKDLKDKLIGNLSREQSELLTQMMQKKEILHLNPLLVWKPCRESLSAFNPFYQFTIGSVNFYMRFDGQIFTSLTNTKGRM